MLVANLITPRALCYIQYMCILIEFGPTENSVFRSADRENPTLELEVPNIWSESDDPLWG